LIISQPVQVSPNIQHSILLGLDFLQSNSVILNYKLEILSLKDHLVRVPLHSKLHDLNCVTSAQQRVFQLLRRHGFRSPVLRSLNDTTVLIEPLSTVQFDNIIQYNTNVLIKVTLSRKRCRGTVQKLKISRRCQR